MSEPQPGEVYRCPPTEHNWVSKGVGPGLVPWVIECTTCSTYNWAEMDHHVRVRAAGDPVHRVARAAEPAACRWDGFGVCMEHNSVHDDQDPGGRRCLAMTAGSAPAEVDTPAAIWEDGYDAGHEDARAVQATYPDPTPNPYSGGDAARSDHGEARYTSEQILFACSDEYGPDGVDIHGAIMDHLRLISGVES